MPRYHHHTLKKKDTTWKIDVNNLSACLLQGLLFSFVDEHDFVDKNEEFYSPSIKKILVTINGMPHQLHASGLQARDIYPELKKHFYEKKHSNVTWKELTTKFGLWIDTYSSTDNTLHGSGRVVGNSGILLQIKKVSETNDGDLTCYVFSIEGAVAHFSVANRSNILTIEKQSLDNCD